MAARIASVPPPYLTCETCGQTFPIPRGVPYLIGGRKVCPPCRANLELGGRAIRGGPAR